MNLSTFLFRDYEIRPVFTGLVVFQSARCTSSVMMTVATEFMPRWQAMLHGRLA